MFFYPIYYDTNRMEKTISYLRIFHASPDTEEVDVFANDSLVAKKLKFKDFTEYLPLKSGMYRIRVIESKGKKEPLYDSNIFLPPEMIFTAAAISNNENLSLKLISESRKKIPDGKAMVRFSHLSPNTPSVNVLLPEGKKVFTDTAYKEVEDYIEVTPGNYIFNVRETANNNILLTVPNVKIKEGKCYTIYAVGLLNSNPPLQVVIPLDGNSYLKF